MIFISCSVYVMMAKPRAVAMKGMRIRSRVAPVRMIVSFLYLFMTQFTKLLASSNEDIQAVIVIAVYNR